MQTLLHEQLYRTDAADRIRDVHRVVIPVRRPHPPPLRGRVAYAVGRLARRLDSESARKAIA